MHVLRLPEPSTAQAAAGCDSVLLACSSRRSRLLKPALFQLEARKCKGVTLLCVPAVLLQGRSPIWLRFCLRMHNETLAEILENQQKSAWCQRCCVASCSVCRALCGAPLEALGLCSPALCAAGWHPNLSQIAFCSDSTAQRAARPLGCYLVEDSHASCSPLLPFVHRAQQQAHGACLHDSAC